MQQNGLNTAFVTLVKCFNLIKKIFFFPHMICANVTNKGEGLITHTYPREKNSMPWKKLIGKCEAFIFSV